ncbi:MAG: excinuclease ABC subunit UvrC [Armatimonadota bacterium]
MNDQLREKLKALPDRPGCYIMKDEQGEVIYVGKAVSLRNRVRSYFQKGQSRTPKIERLVGRVADIEVVVTDSELEALILECNLIKQHRPYFNVRLRDDKQYPYICITMAEDFPRPILTRQLKRDGNRYFGPYTDSSAVYQTLAFIRQAFCLRSCSLTFSGRDGTRPCLYYHINQCLAPCDANLCSKEEYRAVAEEVCMFLEGKADRLLKRLRQEMEKEAEVLNFERAARLRDQIAALTKLTERQKVISQAMTDQDVIALVVEEGRACAQMFFIRGGKLIGQQQFLLDGAADEDLDAALQQFVKQYYEEAPYVPKEILLQTEIEEINIIETWLKQKKGAKVEVSVPKRGEKRKLLDMAISNASLALKQMAARALGEESLAERALEQLQEVLGLPSPPVRIECYDISNLQGSEAVGSMVVFEDGRPARGHYRRFKIRDLPPEPNDYLMLQQVLRRRLERAVSGDPKFTPLPDLLVVDGGKGQLNAALEVLRENNLELPAVGLAKEHEYVFQPNSPDPVPLPRHSPGSHLLQQIRDEAHRFAITFHRSLRGKMSVVSALDQVPGIGKARRTALLKHFKSFRAICEASEDELAQCPGMNRKVAAELYRHLHTEGSEHQTPASTT